MLISTAWAQDAAPAVAGANSLVAMAFQYGPLILIFVVFYMLVIRPQNQAANEQKKAIDALKKGDVVLTEMGLVGEVVKVGDVFVSLRVNAEDTLTVVKQSVRKVLTGDTAKGWEPAPVASKKK
jgi:preprotein translocase subunit YajC